jgi:hypothetical protein
MTESKLRSKYFKYRAPNKSLPLGACLPSGRDGL